MVPNHSARTRNNLRSSAGRAPAGNSSILWKRIEALLKCVISQDWKDLRQPQLIDLLGACSVILRNFRGNS